MRESQSFDDRSATSDPQLICMQAGAGQDVCGEHREESCSCRTEQGTPYKVTDAECRMIARQGAPYNPYRERVTQSTMGAAITGPYRRYGEAGQDGRTK